MTMVVLSGLVLFGLATFVGMIPMVKLITMQEARHELREGSAYYLRRVGSWSVIVFWALATWYFATIVGDWGVTGDLEGAFERSLLRLRVILEIAAAMSD